MPMHYDVRTAQGYVCGKQVQNDGRWEYLSMDTHYGPSTGKSWPSVGAARIGLRDSYSLVNARCP